MSMLSATGALVPQYGNNRDRLALAPGLYLGLFHGRAAINENLEDWGTDGPIIGPLEWAHTTYMCEIKLEFVDLSDTAKYFPADAPYPYLRVREDLVEYNGCYYGDWTLFVAPMPSEQQHFTGNTRANEVIMPSIIPPNEINHETWWTHCYECVCGEEWSDDSAEPLGADDSCPECGALCNPHTSHKIETV